jgi:hypothetical protein
MRSALMVFLAAVLSACAGGGGRPPVRSGGAAPAMTDLDGDGTPDFLRLDRESDRRNFRLWFTFLAEVQYFRAPEEVPREIDDCAALIRFAYREALREHDGAWASALGLASMPPVPPVEKYRYPFTPLGAGLFRVRPGPFAPGDAANGAFAQFADARTLWRLNTHAAGREAGHAEPGDLLFFEQSGQDLPFHAMIYIGPSQIEPDAERWIVYHTGPSGDDAGEIRRKSLGELLRHPEPRWRPLPGNGRFLGVWRWNILRDAL